MEPAESRWPAYLLDRAMQAPPEGCGVVAGTTPVVSFGHPLVARVATLGINPSSGEFLASDGSLLAGERRRLATLASLGVASYEYVDAAVGARILDDCATYFERRPYRWFTPLDRILRGALGVSYFDGTACHLDLVQWATDPLWGQLPDAARSRLLAADCQFLIRQFRSEHYRVVLVNGRTAIEWVERAGLVRWRPVGQLAGPPTATLFVGQHEGRHLLGWSCNLQSQAGAPRHAPALIEFVAKHAGTAPYASAANSPGDLTHAAAAEPEPRRPAATRRLSAPSPFPTVAADATVGDVAAIVQFPHPGGEHVPPGDVMGWNVDAHRRKFLTRPGRRVRLDGTTEAEEELVFWGEWEAPSRVVRRWRREDGLPTVLHDPYWTEPADTGFRQNTDPWVFGDSFLYSNCKQLTPLKRPSALQKLPVGSLILFGSGVADRYVLDTVFVVREILSGFVPGETLPLVDEAFQICTIDSLTTCEPAVAEASFTLYRGATPEDPVAGMFSFVPCRPAHSETARFPRPVIELPAVINPLSRQSPSGAKLRHPLPAVTAAWSTVAGQLLGAGLALGCDFQLPPHRDQLPIEPCAVPATPGGTPVTPAVPTAARPAPPRVAERRCERCYQIRRATQFDGDSALCVDCVT